MEKIMSEEERIRRAEEISARRQNNRIPVSNINNNDRKIKLTSFDRFFIQVISSICIFGLVYFISQHNTYAMDKLKFVMSNDTDFAKVYTELNNFTQSLININEPKVDEENNTNSEEENNQTESVESEINQEETNNEENLNQDNSEEQNKISENNKSEDTTNNEAQNTEGEANGVGGGNGGTEESTNLDDVSYIKNKMSFIKPVTGVITSGYGERTPTDIISANHAGVDIGVNSGTDIVASMEGTVEIVSDYGDYGNHVKITNGDISTLYAHCSKIVVNVGDYISQGQKIAEAGATGKATGPHLHFEIRRNNVTVDPQKVLEL